MITNSLASFYLSYYRNVIPASEIKKVCRLFLFYKIGEDDELVGMVRMCIPIFLWMVRFRYFTIFRFIPYRKEPVWSDDEYVEDEDDPILD